jgi:NAD(P)-dependent dehydrogenase (short-subunit alcohol dehydrogenase family)
MQKEIPTMQNKICLVTGATDGIGFVTARELARQGATVVIVGRNPEKTAATAITLQQATGNNTVDFIVGDLSLLAQVRQVAESFKRKYNRLHVLINNAGMLFAKREVTSEGLEKTFALNHLNYFLLTHLLLDVLKASAPARVINVSSNAHARAKLDFDDLQLEKGYNTFDPYSRSKLMNILFTYELARRLQGTGVTANTLHPGFVATKFGHNNRGLIQILLPFFQRLVARTPEQGAQTSLYLATSPAVEGVTGKYFDPDQHEARSNDFSYDEVAQKRLWEISEKVVTLHQ